VTFGRPARPGLQPVVHPDRRLDVDRVVVLDAALDRHERAGHHDRPRRIERQAGPGTPLRQRARDDHRAFAGADDPAAGPDVNAEPWILGETILADERRVLPMGTYGTRCLRFGRTGRTRCSNPRHAALSRIAASIFPDRPVPCRSVGMVTSSAEIRFGLRQITPSQPSAGSSPGAWSPSQAKGTQNARAMAWSGVPAS
jgi:hypothetical protein